MGGFNFVSNSKLRMDTKTFNNNFILSFEQEKDSVGNNRNRGFVFEWIFSWAVQKFSYFLNKLQHFGPRSIIYLNHTVDLDFIVFDQP